VSFFAELKRRNVFKVGVAYAVAAWILVQVADILLETFKAPEWTMQFIVVVLLVGFFVAVFFAWAYELTPEGVKRESEVDRSQSITAQTSKKLNNAIVVLLVLAVAYLLFDKFTVPDTRQAVNQPVATEGGAEPEAPETFRQSIAVLPFDNRSNREEDQFFTDGIHDDLLTTIARIGSMKVISRTSVMEYKNTTKKIPEIAAELGVANILEGGIQRSGNQVRINVQLIDAQSDEHLWAEIFDRELTAENLFAIQSEISTKIADALKATLSPEEVERINAMPTQNLAAYEAYMRGRQLVETRISANLERAVEDFRAATELDPNFALAWVGLADASGLHATYSTFQPQQTIAIREEAIQKALALDPNLGEAYAALGSLRGDQGNEPEADIAFRRAIELAPNYARAYHWYSNHIGSSITRSQESLSLIQRAAELDPRSAIISSNLASTYVGQGLYSRAEQQYRKTIELNPGFAQSIRSLGEFYAFETGRYDLAVEQVLKALELDPGSAFNLTVLMMFLVELGDLENAGMIRQKIADISSEMFLLGWADMLIAHRRGNAGGVEEAWNWMRPRLPPGFGFVGDIVSMLKLIYGDPAGAREIIVQTNPGWLEPDQWDGLIDQRPGNACLMAWTLSHTGDEEMGAALLDKALAFVGRMPEFMEHSERYRIEMCYLAAGQTEKAMEVVETLLAHNHLHWWNTYHQLPMYEAIRFEPRYREINEEAQRRLAGQRETVARMMSEAGP